MENTISAKDARLMPNLVHIPSEWPISWQWQQSEAWMEPEHLRCVEGVELWTKYLCGFATKEAAERYGRIVGYL